MNKKAGWKFINSWWVILAFIFLLNWTAFLFVGIKTKSKKWILFSVFYFLTGNVIPIVYSSSPKSTFMDILMGIYISSWLACILHAFVIRPKYLEILSANEDRQNETEMYDASVNHNVNSHISVPIIPKINNTLSQEDQTRVKNFYSTIYQIKTKYQLLKSKAATESKFLLVEKFFDQFNEEILNLDKLYEKFCSAISISGKYSNIKIEIKSLEEKVASLSGEAKDFLIKTISEKKTTLQESDNIETHLAVSESKLCYILSIMEKIELIMEANDFSDGLKDGSSDNLNSKLSIFSDELKNSLNSIKI